MICEFIKLRMEAADVAELGSAIGREICLQEVSNPYNRNIASRAGLSYEAYRTCMSKRIIGSFLVGRSMPLTLGWSL